MMPTALSTDWICAASSKIGSSSAHRPAIHRLGRIMLGATITPVR